MAPKWHPTPLSGGDRKALKKELSKSRAMTGILAAQSGELRARGESLIRQADKLSCESWNERMWSDGEPIDPSPTVDQAVNGGFPWLEIECPRWQDAELHRSGCSASRIDDVRARPCQPATLSEMREGRTPPDCDAAAACA